MPISFKDTSSSRVLRKTLKQDQLFELAKTGAQKSPEDILLNLKRFGTLTEDQQFEIAKLCATLDSESTAGLIMNFDELNKTKKFQILEICAEQDGFGTFLGLDQKALGLTNDQIQNLKARAKSAPKRVRERIPERSVKYPEIDLKKALKFDFNYSPQIKALKGSVERLSNRLKDDGRTWLLSALHCDYTFERNEKVWVYGRDLFSHLLPLTDPALRQDLIHSLLQRPLSEETRERMDKVFPKDSSLAKTFPLLAIPLAHLCELGVSEETLTKAIDQLTMSLKDPKGRLQEPNVQTILLKHLHTLVTNNELSPHEKNALLTKIIDEAAGSDNFEKTFRMNFAAFSGMVRLGEISKIKQGIVSPQSLRGIFIESFLDNFPVKLEHFEERYEGIFGESRDPDALVNYAMTIKSSKDKKAMKQLSNYIESVINGTFLQKRYTLDETYNKHLFTLFNENGDLLKKWQKREHFPIKELIGSTNEGNLGVTAEISDDPLDLLLDHREAHGDAIEATKIYSQDNTLNGLSLLGPLLNGKYLLACVKDAEGKVVAESLLSLCILNNKPVLLKLWTLPMIRGEIPEQRDCSLA